MPLISVIVPVYRTEKYINRCVDSILAQTYTELEVLLIDDGSPDRCPDICDEYARKDSRVKVLHKTNAGVSAARNSGLDMAAGDYITFVDSDDYIEPEMYRSMMDVALRYDCDLVMCDCVKDFSDHSELYTHDIRPGFYNKEQLVKEYYPHLLMMENVEYPPTISNWLCLYRRRKSFAGKASKCGPDGTAEYGENSLRYVEGVRFSEDLLFGAQLIHQVNSFFYMKGEAFYHYCMNPESASHSFAADKWNDFTRLHQEAQRYFLKRPDYDFRHQVDLMLLFFVYNTAGGICGTDQLTEQEKLTHIKSVLNDASVREMFRRLSVKDLPVSAKLKILTVCYKYQIGIKRLIRREKRRRERWNGRG